MLSIGKYLSKGGVRASLVEALSGHLKVPSESKLFLTSSGRESLVTACLALGSKSIVVSAIARPEIKALNALEGVRTLALDVNSQGVMDIPHLEQVRPDDYDTVIASCPMGVVPNLTELGDFCYSRDKTLIIEGFSSFCTPGIASVGDAFCTAFEEGSPLPVGSLGAVIFDCPAAVRKETKNLTNTGYFSVNRYSCAAALAELEGLTEEVRSRREITSFYEDLLPRFFPTNWDSLAAYSFFPVFLPSSSFAYQVTQALLKRGIKVERLPVLMDQPGAKNLAERTICLPAHSGVSDQQLDTIGSIFSKI